MIIILLYPCVTASQVDVKMVEGFLQEALMLQGYSHPNVIETLAILFPHGDLPKVVLPFMENGDMKDMLKKSEMVGEPRAESK